MIVMSKSLYPCSTHVILYLNIHIPMLSFLFLASPLIPMSSRFKFLISSFLCHDSYSFPRSNVTSYSIQIAEMIRHLIDGHDKPIPAVLEIPSKDHPYDPTKDSILRRAKVSDINFIEFCNLFD